MSKSKVARHFDVKLDAIVGYREINEGAVVRVLIDYGIGGVKVYEIARDDLIEPASVSSWPKLSYRELQELAKKQGIPANQGRAALVEALAFVDEEE